MLKIILLYIFLFVPASLFAQQKVGSSLTLEEELRHHLRKLDRWGIVQLLRTEQAVDEKQKLRAQTTSNPDELALLSEDEDSGVRFYVAANKNVPLDVQLQLVEDREEVVRGGVALSLHFTSEDTKLKGELKRRIAERLANDDKPIVRMALVSNTTLPQAIYDTLATDPDPIIRQKLSENISIPRSSLIVLARDDMANVRASAAAHTNMPDSLLKELSGDTEVTVRTAVAGNVNTSVGVLDSLVGDEEVNVRLAVAKHPKTRIAGLRTLANDPNIPVQVTVAQHPQAGKELLLALAGSEKDASVREVARERLEPLLRGEIREDVLERWNTD